MICTTYIGSGDVASLMMGRGTKGFLSLLQRFVSDEMPARNAKNSPIDALRTGAILEERFYLTLGDDWFYQYFVQSKVMDVFKCSLDFARIGGGKVVDFIELKTMPFNDYINNIEPIKNDNEALVEYIKTKHKAYYMQVQEQLFCTELQQAHLCFLSVTSYDDEENYQRDIQPNEYTMVTIDRDEVMIAKILDRGNIFQQIKDELTKR